MVLFNPYRINRRATTYYGRWVCVMWSVCCYAARTASSNPPCVGDPCPAGFVNSSQEFVDARVASPGWEERLHFDHLLGNFGFDKSASDALRQKASFHMRESASMLGRPRPK